MIRLRLERDGSVHLPAEACAAFGWQPGDELELGREGDELRLRRARPQAQEVEEHGAQALVTGAVRHQLAEALAEAGVSPEDARRAAERLG